MDRSEDGKNNSVDVSITNPTNINTNLTNPTLALDLIPYNYSLLSKGQGFINLGATCYFNSLLQCLLSCTSIYEVLLKYGDRPHIKQNPLAQHLLSLYESAKNGEPIHEKCVPIWKYILSIAMRKNDKVKLGLGHQDSYEGLMIFMDALDTIPEVKRLFMHKHQIQDMCPICKKCTIDKEQPNVVFEVQSNLKTEQHEMFKNVDEFYNTSMPLNEFLRKQNSSLDADHLCEFCKTRCRKFRSIYLVMAPEILAIAIKRYNTLDTVMPFSAKLEFKAFGKTKKIIYELIAQSEWTGSTRNSGHYWAICKRSDGWKILNDSSCSDGNSGPTQHSYLIFYHFVRTEDIVE